MNKLLERFMIAVEYRISSSYEHLYECGDSSLSVLCSDKDGVYSTEVAINLKTNDTMYLNVWDYKNKRMYNYFPDKEFMKEYLEEYAIKKPYYVHPDDVIEEVNLDVEEDYFDKLYCIINEIDYNTDVLCKLDIDDDILIKLALKAHENNVTLNDYIVRLLTEYVYNEEDKNGG
jgi:hypothetical protein